MGLLVIVLVIGALALASYLIYGRRPSVHDHGALPHASLHAKDDVTDPMHAADQFRDGMSGGTGWA
jgi:hypothetical protein